MLLRHEWKLHSKIMQALVASSEGKMTLHLLLHTRLNRKDLTRDKNSSLTMQIETLN